MMKGLLLKDLYVMKRELRAFLFIIVVFTAISFVGENNSFFMFYGIVMLPIVNISLISYDERSHWDSFLETTPISRSTAVSEKYLLNLLLLLLWSPVVIVFYLIQSDSLGSPLQILCICVYMALFFPAVLYPFIFALGSEKGRFAYFIFIFAAMAAIAAGVSLTSQGVIVFPEKLSLLLLLPPVAAYLISWRLSIALYKKRSL
ncbi:MAG: ABC-2 transporter permease [Oscillospiraceae bacterium]